MKIKIQDVAYYLPEQVITNEGLKRENPGWDFRKLEQRVGVLSRHVARKDETALDLAYEASKKLLAQNPGLKDKIDAIVFCTQSEDYIMPSNSSLLHRQLELPDEVLSFDFNLACSGYVYGLAIVRGLIASGMAKNILLVTGDTYSKYINEKDRSTRALFGDGAAVSWICESPGNEGIHDILCATAGGGYDKFIIPAGGCRLPRSTKTSQEHVDMMGNIRTDENIHMDGHGILTFVKEKVPAQVEKILIKNNLTVSDIDVVVFHQASKLALDFLNQRLGLTPEQAYTNLTHVGNTVSASIPIALRDALDQGRIKKGDRVLMVGFGVGLSYATAIVDF